MLSLKHWKLLLSSCYYLLQSCRLFVISWSSLDDLKSLSDTHNFSNFQAILQGSLQSESLRMSLSPTAVKSWGNLIWGTAKKHLVSKFKCAIVDGNKSFFANRASTPKHIYFASESVSLESASFALWGEMMGEGSAFLTIQLFCLLVISILDIWMDIYPLYWTGKLAGIYWSGGLFQGFHFLTHLHRLTDCCHSYQ